MGGVAPGEIRYLNYLGRLISKSCYGTGNLFEIRFSYFCGIVTIY